MVEEEEEEEVVVVSTVSNRLGVKVATIEHGRLRWMPAPGPDATRFYHAHLISWRLALSAPNTP